MRLVTSFHLHTPCAALCAFDPACCGPQPLEAPRLNKLPSCVRIWAQGLPGPVDLAFPSCPYWSSCCTNMFAVSGLHPLPEPVLSLPAWLPCMYSFPP
ncbi:MAG: hypothetical protein J3K34DRAFT_398448 [Monoraphidium minutum]|nr:MAG: hypothetical protein J3K34DRAFT_398448 [Monoraphidium minutum]